MQMFTSRIEEVADDAESSYEDQYWELATNVSTQEVGEFCTQIERLDKIEGQVHRLLKDDYPVFDLLPRRLIRNLLHHLQRAKHANFDRSSLLGLSEAYVEYRDAVRPIGVQIHDDIHKRKTAPTDKRRHISIARTTMNRSNPSAT
jgi:hypothetical protein